MSRSREGSKSWGDFVEQVVYEYLLTCDVEDIRKTSYYVDMEKHIDFTFFSKKLNKYVGIDVKAPVPVEGYGINEVNYGTFINNRGKPGWLYGEANFAFIVTFEEFIIVELPELRNFLQNQTAGQEPEFGNRKIPYIKFHCRYKGGFRKSVSTLFKIEDVKNLPSAKVVKHNYGDRLKQAFNEMRECKIE